MKYLRAFVLLTGALSACSYPAETMRVRASGLAADDIARRASENLEVAVAELLASCGTSRADLEALERRSDLPKLSQAVRDLFRDRAVENCPAETYRSLVRSEIATLPDARTLHRALQKNGLSDYDDRQADMVMTLVALGARAEVAHVTTWSRNLDEGAPSHRILLALVEAGADSNRGSAGRAPLAYAIAKGEYELARHLLERGAIPSGADAAMAVRRNQPALAQAILAKGVLSEPALVAAIDVGNDDLALSLVTGVFDVDAEVDFEGSTLLHVAASAGRAKVVSALLAAHARVDRSNRVGELPLDAADAGQSSECVRAIEAAGGGRADPTAVAARRAEPRIREERPIVW